MSLPAEGVGKEVQAWPRGRLPLDKKKEKSIDLESHPLDGHHRKGGDSGKEKTGRPSSCHGLDRTNHPKTKDSTKSVHYDNAFSSLFIVHRKRNFYNG